MKKTLLSLALISITYCANAQVGVGTNTPQSTLDVVGKPTDTATPDGVIAPRVSVANLDAKNAAYTTAQTGAIVYVNDISAGSTVTATAAVNAVGYYYFDGTKWVKFTPAAATQDLRLVGTNNHLTQDAGIGSNGSSLGTGTDNIAIGSNTSNKITNASSTIAIGGSALSNLTSGQGNIAIGVQTQASTTTGTYNTAVGYNSLTQQNSYGNSTALGAYAMNNGFGNNNTAIGGYAGAGLAQNSDNTLVGANVLKANVGTNPTGNTLIGSGINPNTANITYANVVALGNNALQDVTNSATATTVSNSTFVGSNATLDATVNAGAIYATAIGAGAVVGASNSIVLGRPPVSGVAQDKVGIGVITPSNVLHVKTTADPVKFEGLQSDATATNVVVVGADGVLKTVAKSGFATSTADASPDAWVNNTANTRVELGTTSTGAARTAGTEVVVSDAGFVGINNTSPTKRLDINAANGSNTTDYIKISNLATLPANTAINSLVMDSSGNIYKNSVQNVEGQIMRYPLTGGTISTEAPVRITTTASTAPNSANNVINTVIGGSVSTNVSAAAGNGSPARTTEQINLPAGIYKIEVRFIGIFAAASSANTVFLKAIVGNSEYSLQPFASNSNTTGTTGYIFSDYINLPTASTLDFTAAATTNNFTIVTSQAPSGGGTSFRSLVLIQRLR
ncbi:beta strand repeat-containing protein [Empedobacter falsenii]